MGSFRNKFSNVLQLQEEEISTMGKISSQAETCVLTNEERNALPSQRCREWGRMEETKHLASKNLDPDFQNFTPRVRSKPVVQFLLSNSCVSAH